MQSAHISAAYLWVLKKEQFKALACRGLDKAIAILRNRVGYDEALGTIFACIVAPGSIFILYFVRFGHLNSNL